MYHFDASALIDLWDNYPISNPIFNEVWQWLDDKASQHIFCISDIALEETKNKIIYKTEHTSLEKNIPGSKLFIQILDSKIKVYRKTADTLHKAEEIKQSLGIKEDNYHQNGVGENDLFIIATASINNATLITSEATQSKLPTNKQKYKIPAVCGLVKTNCISLQKLFLVPTLCN